MPQVPFTQIGPCSDPLMVTEPLADVCAKALEMTNGNARKTTRADARLMTKDSRLWELGISRQALAGAQNPEWLNVSITQFRRGKKEIRKIWREISLDCLFFSGVLLRLGSVNNDC
jgi:hypothetical protein